MEHRTVDHEERSLDKARHVKYWTRCLKTLLPSLYTSNDSNRMYLAYFMLAALDLLDSLHKVTTEDERRDYASWIYHCQHPEGGFRMWPGTDFGERASQANAKWDPANVPATYFALASLLVLGDDFKRVKRAETLQWLRRMQRPDGSFGETLVEGEVHGGNDPRFGYCAAAIRHLLRGTAETSQIPDVDVDSFVRCIHAAESFDGGIADAPFHEPHAGYTFCCLGALAFVGRLNVQADHNVKVVRAPKQPELVLRWLAERQTDFVDPDGALDSEFKSKAAPEGKPTPGNTDSHSTVKQDMGQNLHQSPDKSTMWGSSGPSISMPSLPTIPEVECAGMNGRLNKVADTCYAFWVSASLHIMGHSKLYDHPALRRYLLEMTQHEYMGGFTKFPGDKYADLYHSYLGLAALSLCSTEAERKQDGIRELHAGMCFSKDAASRLPQLWDSK